MPPRTKRKEQSPSPSSDKAVAKPDMTEQGEDEEVPAQEQRVERSSRKGSPRNSKRPRIENESDNEDNEGDNGSDKEEEEGSNDASKGNDKMKERLAKLQQLRAKMNESKQANRQEVYSEFSRSKQNPKEDIRNAKKRREAEVLLARKTAQDSGIEFDRVRAFNWSVEDVERWEAKEAAKAETKQMGFKGHADAAAKKYLKNSMAFKVDEKEYEETKAVEGDSFYRNADSLDFLEDVPSKEGVERLFKTFAGKGKPTKPKTKNPDEEVTFINAGNERFNKKASKAYDKYTAEIKANLERGTAL